LRSLDALPGNLPRQVTSNWDGTGVPVHIVFGKPVDYGQFCDEKGSPRIYRAIAEHTRDVIAALGAEEREHRSAQAS